jgi:WD40 repeat protein
LKGHDSNGHKVLFTPDNAGIVSGGCDGTLQLWDLRTDKEARRFVIRQKRESEDQLMTIALSTDGRRLVSVSRDAPLGEGGQTLIVWDVAMRNNSSAVPSHARPSRRSPGRLLVALQGSNAIRLEEALREGNFLC